MGTFVAIVLVLISISMTRGRLCSQSDRLGGFSFSSLLILFAGLDPTEQRSVITSYISLLFTWLNVLDWWLSRWPDGPHSIVSLSLCSTLDYLREWFSIDSPSYAHDSIQFVLHIQIMQSTIFALLAFGMLLAFVQSAEETSVSEYEIKQGRSPSFNGDGCS